MKLVERALDRISKLNAGEVVKFQWNISDFENIENIVALLRRGEYKKNFFLLLGNTLGNFEINELIYEVREGMKEGDFLLIGNGLKTKEEKEILSAYFNKNVNDWLINLPLKLGLKRDDVEFGVRLKDYRVELYFTIKQNKKIEFQNKSVYFDKGDQIIVAVSYKYTEEDFMHYAKMYFGDVELFTSQDGSYALVLCKK